MRSLSTIWREPAYVLGVVAIVAILLYNRAFIDPVNFAGYWMSTFANASIFLIFTAPVGSASAAIIAARARRAGIWDLPLARSRVAITVRLLLPSFVASSMAQLFGLYVLATATWGAPGRIPLEILLAWAAILIFHVTLGYLLGRFLPVTASIPLAIFASYCWLGFTWTVSYFPIRYLSGLVIAACCSVDTTIDERAIAAVVTFSLIVAVAFLLLASIPPRGTHWNVAPIAGAVAVAGIVVATAVGLETARGLPAQPVTARGSADLVCTGNAPTICVYPEQLQQQDPRLILKHAYANLRAEGIPLPAVITASNTAADRSSLRVVVPTQATPAQLVYTMSAAVLPDDIAPYCGDGSDYPKRLDVSAVALWWLQKTAAAGIVDEALIGFGNASPESESALQRFRRLSPSRQRDWYLAASPALRQCASEPIEVPFR